VEIFLEYLKQAEDGLTDIYRRLTDFPPPASDEIQRDIANVVVLLYGLRRNGSGEFAPSEAQPHPLVFAAGTVDRLAMKAGAD
jgi:hypothetical protein